MHSTAEWIEEAATGAGPLDIVVPYTTPELTRLALEKAAQLSREGPSRIRVVRVQRVPFPLPLQQPPVAVEVLREQTEQITRGLQAAEILIVVTRDADKTLLEALGPESIVVIASRRRRWPTAQDRLKKLCERHGGRVAFFPVA